MKKFSSILLALILALSVFPVNACVASPSFSVPKGYTYDAKTKTLKGPWEKGLSYPTFADLDDSKAWISDPVQKENAILVNNASYGWALADPIRNGQIQTVKFTGNGSQYSSVRIVRNGKGQVTAIQPTKPYATTSCSEFEYNSRGQLAILYEIPSHGDTTEFQFTYDSQGRMSSYTKNPNEEETEIITHTFTYGPGVVTETIQSPDGTRTVTHQL